MKLLKTKQSFYSEILKLSKEKPSFFYIASYNMSIDDKMEKVFHNLPVNCDVKIIIGLNEDVGNKQIAFFKRWFSEYNLKLFKNCHLKLVITNKSVIIGGRNITNSEWMDLSCAFIGKEIIAQIKKEFLSHFKKRGL